MMRHSKGCVKTEHPPGAAEAATQDAHADADAEAILKLGAANRIEAARIARGKGWL